MPTADYARTMARYGAWQNAAQTAAAGTLDPVVRERDGGAFFGSIAGTLNHLLWGDRIWMSRFADTPKPTQGTIPDSVRETPDWNAYADARRETDGLIGTWAAGLSDEWFAGDLTWWSGAAGREVSRPRAMLVVHFFNHGTHHRGQVNALLTAAGAVPGDTDLFLMP